MDNVLDNNIVFDLPKNQSNVIKVIGVGGGGSNAVNHMFAQGIKGVDFVVCNTDSQALENSPVSSKIQLGVRLTEGLGAGANPEIGQQAALENIEEIEKLLDTNTKMVFITAGMGGGTGTGAAPVIAQLSKDKDILTVGIVTIPFQFEGKVRQEQALKGVEKLRKVVDSLIVINNNKLREVYGNLGFKAGFSKADEVLATASRGIAEVITHHYTQNIDLRDAKTVLSNSGTAIMGSAVASGENRAKEAIVAALDSPLLNDNKITGAKNVLLLIVSGENEITLDEIGEINDHIQSEAGHNANIIMGVGEDTSLGDAIAVTIIATGFNVEQQREIASSSEPNKIIHVLGNEQQAIQDLSNAQPATPTAPTPDMPLSQQNAFSMPINRVENSQNTVQNGLDFEEKKTIIQTQTQTHTVGSQIVEEDKKTVAPVVKTNDFRDLEVIEPKFVIVKAKPVVEKPAMSFSFDLEEQNRAFQQEEISFDLPIQEEQVKEEIVSEVEPVQEENKIVRYSLEDYLEVEENLVKSTDRVVEEKKEQPVEEEFTVRVAEPKAPVVDVRTTAEELNPMEDSIQEILRNRAEERKRRMKDFNHKFNNASEQLNDLEKEPAYKRLGVELGANPSTGISRTSLGVDNENNVQLRSNNSYLHDNVD